MSASRMVQIGMKSLREKPKSQYLVCLNKDIAVFDGAMSCVFLRLFMVLTFYIAVADLVFSEEVALSNEEMSSIILSPKIREFLAGRASDIEGEKMYRGVPKLISQNDSHIEDEFNSYVNSLKIMGVLSDDDHHRTSVEIVHFYFEDEELLRGDLRRFGVTDRNISAIFDSIMFVPFEFECIFHDIDVSSGGLLTVVLSQKSAGQSGAYYCLRVAASANAGYAPSFSEIEFSYSSENISDVDNLWYFYILLPCNEDEFVSHIDHQCMISRINEIFGDRI